MISVRGVSKSFGRLHAVRDVSFEVGRGEVVGLLGANGAGKTTTIRVIAGFLPPDAGTVAVGGHDTITASLEARRCVGYLPEAAPAYGEMATEDYLDFRGRLYGMARADRRKGVGRVCDLCELHEVRGRRVGQLSRGYRQRVGLAAAILHDPPVLVLDEPTSALDPRQIRHTRSLVRELARDKAVLVSSHILAEVEKTCDRVVILAQGAVRADASPAALLASARAEAPYLVEAWSPAGPDAAAATLRAVPGVLRVERGGGPGADGWAEFKVAGRDGDLRESIARGAAGAGVVIRELRREMPGLERLVLELIEDSGARAAGGAAG
jgi:gliding motility-associated transport system ATP-binding protein